MSEFYMIVIWMIVMAILFSLIQTKQYVVVNGKKEQYESWFFAILVFLPVFYMVANRPDSIGDTYAYRSSFQKIPNSLRELVLYLSQIKKDKGFIVLSGVIKILIGENSVGYFWVLALIQGFSLICVFRKYSTSYLISMFLFIISSDYIAWMYNGIRQFTAVTIIFSATPLMLKKRWIPLIGSILLASTIHQSALLMIPIVFMVQGRAWNKKTMLFTFFCILALIFADKFTNILDTLLSDTQYMNAVSEWKSLNDDGTNILRVLVYSIPAIMSFWGRKWIDSENDSCINLCTNMSIISSALYLVSAGTSGVFIGRLPIFTSLYGYILLPYLIDKIFTPKSSKIVKLVMIGLYMAFYYYQVHIGWGIA